MKKVNTYGILDNVVLDYILSMNASRNDYEYRLINDIYSIDNFDRYNALAFIRVWDIINNDLKPIKSILFLIFMAYDCDAYKALDIFNRYGGHYSNIYALRTETQRIKKKIIKIYNDRYGTN